MEEQLISFETAKLAKERGFNWKVRYSYGHNINPHIAYPNEDYAIPSDFNTPNIGRNWKGLYSAPTRSLLQKWLREIHKIDVLPRLEPLNNKYGGCTIYDRNKNNFIESKEYYSNYEEALEEGLQEALKLIEL